jgi:NADH-quinone oxidoreductase subunit G
VLRVLGNLLRVPDFEYDSAEEVCAAARAVAENVRPDNTVTVSAIPPATTAMEIAPGDLEVPMYGSDAIVRRAAALQMTREARG